MLKRPIKDTKGITVMVRRTTRQLDAIQDRQEEMVQELIRYRYDPDDPERWRPDRRNPYEE